MADFNGIFWTPFTDHSVPFKKSKNYINRHSGAKCAQTLSVLKTIFANNRGGIIVVSYSNPVGQKKKEKKPKETYVTSIFQASRTASHCCLLAVSGTV